MDAPQRQIRAAHTAETITVYQAYGLERDVTARAHEIHKLVIAGEDVSALLPDELPAELSAAIGCS